MPSRVTQWRSRRTGTPRSLVGLRTTPTPAPRGCSRAAGACGRSRVASWSAGVVLSPSGEQGYSVAIAADGNTAIVGSFGGEAWVYTRSGGVWSQQGNKNRTGAVSSQRNSVALSADGNIAIIGGPHDGDNAGSSSSPSFEGTGATWVVHPQWWGVDAARRQAGRHGWIGWCLWPNGCPAGLVSGALGRWQHRHCRSPWRQQQQRRRVGLRRRRLHVAFDYLAAAEPVHRQRQDSHARRDRNRDRAALLPVVPGEHWQHLNASRR